MNVVGSGAAAISTLNCSMRRRMSGGRGGVWAGGPVEEPDNCCCRGVGGAGAGVGAGAGDGAGAGAWDGSGAYAWT